MLNDPVVIVGAARTPMGGFQGDFASLSASDLGAEAIKAAIARAGIRPLDVDEVIMGNVLPAGQGQAPARQASLKAGVPLAVGCTTVNKMCGSAMKAAMLAHDLIVAGSADIVVAGGMESMTNAPYLMPKARGGYRMGSNFDRLSLSDLVAALEKKDHGSEVGGAKHAPIQALQYGLVRILKNVKLSDLILPGHRIDVPLERLCACGRHEKKTEHQNVLASAT